MEQEIRGNRASIDVLILVVLGNCGSGYIELTRSPKGILKYALCVINTWHASFFSVMAISCCMPVAPPRERAQTHCGAFIKH